MQSDPTTRLIPLTRGACAVVDAADYPILNAYKWYAWQPNLVTRIGSRSTYYAARNVCNTVVLMHRTIMNAAPGTVVDHRDCDGLNNTRANLRFATLAQNCQNVGLRSTNTSGYIGVTRYGDKWGSKIRCDGCRIHLGYFAVAEEAARAYDAAAIRLRGEFAHLNFP